MSYKCEDCGRQYKVDLVISDILWERIKPAKNDGLLCGICIMEKLEAFDTYGILRCPNSLLQDMVREQDPPRSIRIPTDRNQTIFRQIKNKPSL